jgi:hypothetical protein
MGKVRLYLYVLSVPAWRVNRRYYFFVLPVCHFTRTQNGMKSVTAFFIQTLGL